jgi:hypothetical protein
MSIVKRKDALGRSYYFNNTTGKRTTEESYKRSRTAKKTLAPHMARKGKPAKAVCNDYGYELKASMPDSRRATKYGKLLRSCGPKVTNKKGRNQYS